MSPAKVNELGWMHLPYADKLHYFKSREGSFKAMSACWIMTERKYLKSNDDLPHCALCDIMLSNKAMFDVWIERS